VVEWLGRWTRDSEVAGWYNSRQSCPDFT